MFRYLECVKANYPDLYRQLQIIKMSHDPINFRCAAWHCLVLLHLVLLLRTRFL